MCVTQLTLGVGGGAELPRQCLSVVIEFLYEVAQTTFLFDTSFYMYFYMGRP